MRRILAVLLFALLAPQAFAHAHLHEATPAENASLAEPPTAIILHFSEPLEAKLSRIEVTDPQGKRVDQGKAQAADGDASTLSVKLGGLEAGTYTVKWRATSVDTHHTQGEYTFTLNGES